MRRWIRCQIGCTSSAASVLVVLGLVVGLSGCDDVNTKADDNIDIVEQDAPSDIEADVEVPDAIELDAADTRHIDVLVDARIDLFLDATADALGEDCSAPSGADWTTCGGWLVDAEGRRVLLRGVNVGNIRKQAPYAGGTTPEDFATMRQLGFNHIRLIWSWAAAMPQPNQLDEVYLDRLADEIESAGDYGIFVLVDSHQDLFGEAIRTQHGPVGNGAPVWACPEEIAGLFDEPASPWFVNYADPAVQGCFDHLLDTPELQDAFADAWGAVAERVADLPNVVGYDLWNEPYWGTRNINTWEEQSLLPLYERLAAAILEHDPTAVVFVEPGLQKNVFGWSLLPRMTAPHVVYAPHLYNPSMEAGDPWSGSIDYFSRRVSGDQQDAESWEEAPLYYGEWGVQSTNENATDYATAMADLYDEQQLGWAYWDWGPTGSYSLTDSELTPNATALSLARPYPERLAGDDLIFAIDHETGDLFASWRATHTDVPTIVVVPELSPQAEAAVSVIGGTVLEAANSDRLEIQASAVGEIVELRLTPQE